MGTQLHQKLAPEYNNVLNIIYVDFVLKALDEQSSGHRE